ncbi:MAG: hypothetical protein ASARMPRED_008964 [Alectoria sarmentosa]|nr:MAG: hypothetical protein ASARMPRED_008964 [Alectoria sarmentosa]
MDSALIITSMDNPLQHLRSVRAEDLPPTEQACYVCATPWGIPEDVNGSLEDPTILPCGCVVGSSCLEQSFQKSPRCPRCNTTIRIIPGVNAPLHPNTTDAYLRQLELLRSGLNDWPIPSTEHRPASSRRAMPDGASRTDDDDAEQTEYDLQAKLDVLNGCHGTFLSMRELEICISLIDHHTGTGATTAVVDVLDAFLKRPLLRWEADAFLQGESTTTTTTTEQPVVVVRGEAGSGSGKNVVVVDGEEVRDALVSVNMRAGTSFLPHELELVLSLMGFIHSGGGGGRGVAVVGLRDVLGLRHRGGGGRRLLHGRLLLESPGFLRRFVEEGEEEELVGAFGTLDVRVGERNAVQDLGDVFSQATL